MSRDRFAHDDVSHGVRPTARIVVLFAGIAGLVCGVRILASVDITLSLLVLMVGLCTGWAANAAAVMLLALFAYRRIRKQSIHPDDLRVAALVPALLGAGWALIGLALLFVAFTETAATLVVGGAAAIGLALWLRGRPLGLPVVAALLGATVLAFQIPRENGTYSINWKTSETRWNTNTNGGENCNGFDLGDRPLAIAPYRPDYVIESQLHGSFGELVGERLGQRAPPPPYVPSQARVSVSGQLDYGGLGCYLPLHKSLDIDGTISTQTSFSPQLDDGSLSCGASHQLSFDIHVTATGIASCRDLATEAAAQIADQVHAHARAVCGY